VLITSSTPQSLGGAMHDLDIREAACRDTINVVYNTIAARWRVISKLALTPFSLHGREYASIEVFLARYEVFGDLKTSGACANAARAGAEGTSIFHPQQL
jgi:hypothetical protein